MYDEAICGGHSTHNYKLIPGFYLKSSFLYFIMDKLTRHTKNKVP